MRRRTILGAAVVAAAVVAATAVAWPGPAAPRAEAASGTLTFTFYDTSGTLLTAAQVHAITRGPGTGQNAGYDADAFVNPSTLEMVGARNPLGNGLSATLPASPVSVDFAINWLASPTNGYSLVVLDNGGAGFSTGGTVNFTYRAAHDAKMRLDAALAARTSPAYVHSAAFDAAYGSAAASLAQADAPGASEATKGRYGALALDRLDIANDLLLKEYGTAYATVGTPVADRWSGFTIDESKAADKAYQTPVDTIQTMTSATPATETGWVRFVMDPTASAAIYANEIAYAHSKGLKVLFEPVDSAYCDASSPTSGFDCSLAAYHAAFVDATTHLTGTAVPDAFEIGNEVNGDWVLSSGANTPAARLADAASVVATNVPGALRVVTLFWQLNTAASPATSLFNWARTNLTPSIRAGIDVVLLSTYVEQAPLGLAFDQVMSRLQAEFSGKQIGIGELGYWIQGQRYWWAYRNLSSGTTATAADLQPVADQYYRAALGYAGSVGGGFWWNYPSEVAKSTTFQAVFGQIRDDLGTGGGNAHGGAWAVRGALPASAAFVDLYQNVAVSPSTTDTAALWIRGSGTIKVTVWGNAAWTNSLATANCVASATWTRCSLPSFSTGSRSVVYLDFEDRYDGAGTVYVDDVFVGQSGGSNLVTNPGFESGPSGWTSTDATVWSVVQP